MRKSSPAARQRGYAIAVLIMAAALGALYTLTDALAPLHARARQTATNQEVLLQAKEALIAYAASYRDANGDQVFGYLPCPDSQAIGNQAKGNGLADSSCGATGQTVAGLLPFKTLGLPDLRDAAGGCLWYVVSGNFKTNAATMNWDTQGQLAYTDSQGSLIATPDDRQGGVAAAIIAAGPALSAQRRSANGSNLCGALPSEIAHYLDGGYAFPSTATTHLQQGGPTSGSINDQIITVSPREIFARIMARADFKNPLTATPPGQINVLSSLARIALEQKIQQDYTSVSAAPVSAKPTQLAGHEQFNGKLIGSLPPLTLIDANYRRYLAHWADQYRYVVCSPLDTPCLSIAGRRCRGALLFGGRATSGGPRPSAQKPPVVLPAPPNPYLAYYFEPLGALPLLNSPATQFIGSTAYDGASPSADVATCLFPGSFLSFAKDLNRGQVATAFPSTPLINVNSGTKTVTLGSATAASSASACFWINQTFRLSRSLRVYFQFKLLDVGEGFTFVIADRATTNPSNTAQPACGDKGDALGYSGPGIGLPKFGLEIDTKSTVARSDPSASHIAQLYWGTTVSPGDDNTHGAGTAGAGTQPQNPRNLMPAPAGIANLKSSDPSLPYSSWTALLNTTVHVRIDLIKGYDPASRSARYTWRAYVADHFGGGINAGTCTREDMADLSQDVTDMPCTKTPTVEQTNILLDDIGTGEAFANAYAGFTVGQEPTAASRQLVQISNFLLRSE